MLLKIPTQLSKILPFEMKCSYIFYILYLYKYTSIFNLFLSKIIDIDSYTDALSQGEATQLYIWFLQV